jgi:hypothetical protein
MNNPNPFDPKYGQAIADMTNAFLKWPLPKTVCSDGCCTTPDYPHPRYGTNLLNLPEALQMIQEVVCPIIATYLDDRPAAYSYKFPMKKLTDTQRLNWLQKMNACLRYDAEDDSSIPQAVVFAPTIKDGESTFEAVGHGDTYREAIDDAINSEIMNNPTKAIDQNERAELQQALENPENQPSQFGTVPMDCLKGVHANKEMTPLKNCPGAQGASFILPATEQVEQVLKQLGVEIWPHE